MVTNRKVTIAIAKVSFMTRIIQIKTDLCHQSEMWHTVGLILTVTPMASVLEIIPLGGIGEFGMNCMAVRYGDEMLILDAGMGFPGRDSLRR